MLNFRTTRIIPIALVLILVTICIAGLVSFGRTIFFPDAKETPTSDIVMDTFLDPNSVDHSVKMVVRGALGSDEDFSSYYIQISPTNRKVTTFKGYLKQPVDDIVLENNIPAYEQFVYALNRANMMKGVEFKDDKNDTRGICATGKLYEFQVLEANKPLKTLWTTSCHGAKGSLSANLDQISNLFTTQVPGSSKIINKIH